MTLVSYLIRSAQCNYSKSPLVRLGLNIAGVCPERDRR